jgi:hypothetical protein
MNSFIRHIPAFVELTTPPQHVSFTDTAELLDIDIVKQGSSKENFLHFAMSNNYLMAIFADGEYWAVGRIEDPSSIDLPEWDRGGR